MNIVREEDDAATMMWEWLSAIGIKKESGISAMGYCGLTGSLNRFGKAND